ncbi:tetratricopeptide repeat-containing sensor histidine kinase [Flavobacterium phycosphaerae]|uniref:tetratricopeptide repeat-containing sensor histidine kinase n=1 Tax=Flavobacterium phycosphaerae TaxID=2697515 RepID=UPI00138A4AB5|nr:sensor histidine kinase [Flavobacterium phycosphaerae]
MMYPKQFFFTVLFLAFNIPSFYGQTSKIDSLKGAVLKTTNDTSITKLYIAIGTEFEKSNADSTFAYYTKALIKAKKENLQLEIANTDIVLAKYFIMHFNDYNKAYVYTTDAKNILEKLLLKEKSKIEIKKIQEKLISVYSGLSIYYSNIGQNDTSVYYTKKGLRLAKIINNKNLIARSFYNLGIQSLNTNNYTAALNWFLSSLKIKEKIDSKNLHEVYIALGDVYSNLKKYSKAVEYYSKVFTLPNTNYDANVRSYIATGNIYLKQNETAKALAFFTKAEVLVEKYHLKRSQVMLYNSLGIYHQIMGNNDLALQYFFELLTIGEQTQKKEVIAITKLSIASIYEKKNNDKMAIQFASSASQLAKEISRFNTYWACEQLLSTLYEKQKLHQLALHHYKKFITTRDSIENKINTEKIVKAEMNYEFEKKEIIAKAKQDKARAVALQELNKQKLIRNCIAGFSLLIVILSIIIVLNYKKRAKISKALAQKSEELYQQKAVELIKNEQVKSMRNYIKGEENERSRIASELHDGIGGSLSAIKLKLSKIAEEDKNEQIEKVIKNVDVLYHDVRSISHNLITPQLKDSIFIEVINNLVNDIKEATSLEITLEYLEEDKINLLSEEIQVTVYRMIQELLKNSIAHSNGTKIEINVTKFEHELNLVIEDNGAGFDTSKKKLGIGLRNLEARTKALGGKLIIDSVIGRGSAFNITIPC